MHSTVATATGSWNLKVSRIERLAQKIKKHNTCWIYQGFINKDGYGRFNVNKRPVFAHRAFYELIFGEISEGLVIDHECHNELKDKCKGGVNCLHRRCVNPKHMKVVTLAENNASGNSQTWRKAITHCPKGHEYTKENTQIKIRNNWVNRSCRQCKRDYMVIYSRTKRSKLNHAVQI